MCRPVNFRGEGPELCPPSPRLTHVCLCVCVFAKGCADWSNMYLNLVAIFTEVNLRTKISGFKNSHIIYTVTVHVV